MISLGGGKYLGLALGERSIVAAQVKIVRDRRELVAANRFDFPPELSWEDPAALGAALRQFLRQHRFTAPQAVVGVPARWLMTRPREVPPASAAIAASALRLHAERDFPSDLELVCDFAGRIDSRRPSRILLAAMRRQHLDRIVVMADAARLSLLAVTSSSLALAGASTAGGNGALSLIVDDEAAELVVNGPSAPRLLRHLGGCGTATTAGNGHAAAAMASLGGEVQRALAMMPHEEGSADAATVVLWDGLGLDPAAADALIRRGGVKLRSGGDLASLGIREPGLNPAEARRAAAAVALALAGAARPSLDFLHTRLAAPKVHRVSRQHVLAVAAIALVVGGLAWLWVDVLKKESAVAAIRDQIKLEDKKKKEGAVIAEKVKFASGWFDERPALMECLRELTLLFPQDGRIIATSFSFHEDGKVEVGARTPEQSLALSLGDRLRGNNHFTDVVLPSIGDLAGRFREAPFTVKFTYVGKE